MKLLVVLALAAVALANENLEPNCPRRWEHSTADTWGASCPAWSKCSGNAQSPVDIITPMRLGVPKGLEINYKNTTINLFNTGRAIKWPVNIEAGHTFCLNGETFYLRLIEFHSPSEHRVNGRSFDLEMQLVHDSLSKQSSHAIISVFFNLGKHSWFLDQFFFDLPEFDDCKCGNNRVEPFARGTHAAEQCDNGPLNANAPNACRPDCRLPICGDGIVDHCEQCDMGDRNNDKMPNRCRSGCTLPTCGDGVVDANEECDDGNRHNRDGCSSICKLECGDGSVNPVEECDTGDQRSNTLPNTCRMNCRNSFCGDGVTDASPETARDAEECDDGENNSDVVANACRSNCRRATCGDGVVDAGETCDKGAVNATNTGNGAGLGCSATCQTECGNGVVDEGETCDAGAANSNAPNSACRMNCQQRRCGDGILDTAGADGVLGNDDDEQCDEGADSIFCTGCRVRCGNGRIEAGEECDNAQDNGQAGQFCRRDCKRATCGDGIVDALLGEECDATAERNADKANAPCRADCQKPKCGDGFVDTLLGEECDDGNRIAEDGCDPNCRHECGNNKIGPGEQCDDGMMNADEKDACRRNCKLPTCGDGIVDTGEQCDDGANNGNTPNACRKDCRLPYCGDGFVDDKAPYDEHCDRGAANSDVDASDDGCSWDCRVNRCRRSLLGKQINPHMGLPMHNVSALCYTGSLTSPPCTEQVKWVVFENAQTLSDLQFQQFRSVIGPNNRPLQPLNGRRPQFCNDIAVPPHAWCGNGWKDEGEECDHGVRNSDSQSDACRTNCKTPKCGDNVVDVGAGEECDTWNDPHCTAGCKLRRIKINPHARPFWSYKRSGEWPLHWPACGEGKQSPIDLHRNHTKDAGSINTKALDGAENYNTAVPVNIYNTGNLPIWNVGTGAANFFRFNSVNYALSSVEVHSPSEHSIEGKRADFEVQLHHVNAETGRKTSVAILYNVGAKKNAFLDRFWFYLPHFTHRACGNGKVEGATEECDDGHLNNDHKPNHCRTNCRVPHCGDGVVDRGEQCDDGFWNSDRPDACRPVKRNAVGTIISRGCLKPRCGDGITDHGEECDDGNTDDNDGCSKKCKNECGDGVVNTRINPLTNAPYEACDDGALNSDITPNACRKNCQRPHCGDGVVDSGESCDLGAVKNSNTTSNRCRRNCALPRCGDGVIDWAFGEQCDDGVWNHNTLGNCTETCQKNCGDGELDDQILADPLNPNSQRTPEECDDADWNRNQNSMCRTNCRLPRCGDGILDTGSLVFGENSTRAFDEKCDEGADNFETCCPLGTSDPTCTCPRARCSSCALRCGNGIVDDGEDCDAGTANSDKAPNCCRTDCRNAHCGDGVLDDNEECDMGLGNGNSANACRGDCTLPRCGDGVTDSGEQCDEGAQNGVAGSGCTKTCLKLCGNGLKDAGEECDDGALNGDGADACRSDCKLPTCGDGITDSGEQCDEKRNPGDNTNPPNKCRTDCTLPVCGDNIVDSEYGEDCDNGAARSDTSGPCSTTCKTNEWRVCAPAGVSVSLSGALPKLDEHHGVFVYEGSESKPSNVGPSCEHNNHQWVVFKQIQHMSKRQADHYRKIWPHHTSRGLQSNVGREVTCLTNDAECGNCIREAGEECDDGHDRNSDHVSGACRKNCKRARCGDGIVDHTLGEQCDGAAGCDEFCHWIRACPVSANGCPGACSGNRVHCPSGSCNNQMPVPANSTIININFANLLSKASCTSCSR